MIYLFIEENNEIVIDDIYKNIDDFHAKYNYFDISPIKISLINFGFYTLSKKSVVIDFSHNSRYTLYNINVYEKIKRMHNIEKLLK
jgi:hypothetical protein